MNPYTIKQELKKLWFRIPGSKTELLKKQILILIVSFLLAALLFMQGTEQQFLLPGNQIQREPIGGVEKKIPLNVTGISGKKKEEIYVTVSPRLYSKEEADKAFAKLQGKMESLILSDEDSFDGISGNIQLKKIFNPENIKATWSFRPESLWTNQKETPLQDSDKSYTKYRDILEDSGQVHHEYLEKNQILTGTLEVVLSANIHPEEEVEGDEISSFFNENNEITYNSPTYSYALRILPLKLSETEALEMALQNTLQYSNEHTRSRDKLLLPKEIMGHHIHFSEKKNFRYLLIPVLGLFACFLLPLQALEQQKTRQKARLSSLTRNSFSEIAKHYNYLVKNCHQESHPLYEELNTLLNQLASNVGEGEAYLNFSKRIALKPYGKLISLIEQNRKNGSKDLSRQLHMEMEEAFSVRKHMAKRLGEEAGTKLLLPLILQLFVIMLMILYPAMQSLH